MILTQREVSANRKNDANISLRCANSSNWRWCRVQKTQTKKGPVLQRGLEGIPEPKGFEEIRGDNQ
jgi:hypothetical protein